MRKLSLIIAAVLVLAGCSAKPDSSATDLWVKSSETSMAGGMTAVYGTITNNTGTDIVLTGGQTDAANCGPASRG